MSTTSFSDCFENLYRTRNCSVHSVDTWPFSQSINHKSLCSMATSRLEVCSLSVFELNPFSSLSLIFIVCPPRTEAGCYIALQ